MAPSFEMRWPGPASKDSTAAKNPMAFQLTSHKQLDQAEQIFEELLGESDESPPYLPAKLKPSAPPLVEKPVWRRRKQNQAHKFQDYLKLQNN